jgi:hypothetical protein
VLCIFLCFALGVANIFHPTQPLVIPFSIVCLYVSHGLSAAAICV